MLSNFPKTGDTVKFSWNQRCGKIFLKPAMQKKNSETGDAEKYP